MLYIHFTVMDAAVNLLRTFHYRYKPKEGMQSITYIKKFKMN